MHVSPFLGMNFNYELEIDQAYLPAQLGLKRVLNHQVGVAHKHFRAGERDQGRVILAEVLAIDANFEEALILQNRYGKVADMQ